MWRRRLTTALLITVWLITPCVEKTAEEHACCIQMGSDCGKVPMPGMSSCCGATTPPNPAVVSRTTDYLELRATLLPAVFSAQTIHWLRFETATPPPLLPQASFDILRI